MVHEYFSPVIFIYLITVLVKNDFNKIEYFIETYTYLISFFLHLMCSMGCAGYLSADSPRSPYEPMLDCYYDPKTKQYYDFELNQVQITA